MTNKNECPKCTETLDLIDNDVNIEDNTTWAEFECSECGYAEKRIYKFDTLEVVDDGTDNRGEDG